MVASGGARVGLYPARVGEVEWIKKDKSLQGEICQKRGGYQMCPLLAPCLTRFHRIQPSFDFFFLASMEYPLLNMASFFAEVTGMWIGLGGILQLGYIIYVTCRETPDGPFKFLPIAIGLGGVLQFGYIIYVTCKEHYGPGVANIETQGGFSHKPSRKLSDISLTTKGGSGRLKKSYEVGMMMMIAASLM